MNDLVGSNTTTESTAQGNNKLLLSRTIYGNSAYPCSYTISSKGNTINTSCTSSTCKRYCKALSDQQRAVSQPQYVLIKQTNAVMEPTLVMHKLDERTT